MENFRLKVFRTVAEKLNFREAAEALLLTQPAVTLQVKALEEELSIRLFDRTGNRIVLTEAGRRLLKHANQLAALAQEAERDIAALRGVEFGELHIGASTTIAQYFLPRLIGEFGKLNPRVSVSVVSGNTQEIVDALLKGTIAVGLVEGPVLRRGIRIEPFLDDEIVMILPAQHEWVGQTIPKERLGNRTADLPRKRFRLAPRGGKCTATGEDPAQDAARRDGTRLHRGDQGSDRGGARCRFRVRAGDSEGAEAGNAAARLRRRLAYPAPLFHHSLAGLTSSRPRRGSSISFCAASASAPISAVILPVM